MLNASTDCSLAQGYLIIDRTRLSSSIQGKMVQNPPSISTTCSKNTIIHTREINHSPLQNLHATQFSIAPSKNQSTRPEKERAAISLKFNNHCAKQEKKSLSQRDKLRGCAYDPSCALPELFVRVPPRTPIWRERWHGKSSSICSLSGSVDISDARTQ